MAYIYRHIRLDKNEPFYIGIGFNNDYKRAFEINKNRRNKIWSHIASKTSFQVDIILNNLTWDEACKKEKEFIKLYGRIDKKNGILSNLTDGGDGTLGVIKSESNLLELSKRMKGSGNPMFNVTHPKELIEKIRQKNIGKKAWNKGIPMLESQKNALSKAKKGCKTWNKGIPRTDEEKRKISESHLAKNKISWNKGKKGVNGFGKSKIVLNLESGIFYQSAKEVACAYNKNYTTLKCKLNGNDKNNTQFIYI
jgi:hypothetical protein